jgi:hypothetical protein
MIAATGPTRPLQRNHQEEQMKASKTIVALALVSALAISALDAAGASAAGTTAFTCTSEGGELDFADAHCDNQVGAGKGTFGHVAITGGSREITLSNEKTASETTAAQPSVLIGKISGTNVEVRCASVTGNGTLTNEEVEGTMRASGTMTIEHSSCTVSPSPCTVAEPIVYKAKYTTYQTETEMGLRYTPLEPPNFGTFTLKNCTLAKTFGIAGTMETTPAGTPLGKGATQVWTAAMSSLTWGSNPYTLEGAVTLRLKGGDPIVFTT